MITTTHIQQLEGIEGEFLFIIDSDINPATGAFNSSKEVTNRKRHFKFICSEDSKQWNKVKDLANNVINYLQSTSYTAKGNILNELSDSDTNKYSLVYIDLGTNNIINDVLKSIHNKLSENAKVIIKSVDTTPIIDYINNNNLKSPSILPNGYISYVKEQKAFVLGGKVSKEVSNNF